MKGPSFVVFFLLLVGLIIFIRYMGRKVHYKKIKWILGGYIAILLISIIVVHMLPGDDFLEEVVGQNGEWVIDQEYQDFYNAVEEGRLDQIESMHKNKKWNFEYAGEQLEIVAMDGENFGIRIIVKNKDIDDGIIEVAGYTGRSIINGIDCTDKIKPPEIILEGDQLKIIEPERQEIELAGFDRDFTIKQFLPGGYNYRGSLNISHMGPPVLYIRVPKNIQVKGYY